MLILGIVSVVFVVSALFNTEISLVDGKYGNILLYIISSLSGSFCLIQVSHRFVEQIREERWIYRLLDCLGKNSIIVLGTHMLIVEIIRLLDYKLLGNRLYLLGYAEGFVFAGLVVFMEVCIIVILDKYKKNIRVR